MLFGLKKSSAEEKRAESDVEPHALDGNHPKVLTKISGFQVLAAAAPVDGPVPSSFGSRSVVLRGWAALFAGDCPMLTIIASQISIVVLASAPSVSEYQRRCLT